MLPDKWGPLLGACGTSHCVPFGGAGPVPGGPGHGDRQALSENHRGATGGPGPEQDPNSDPDPEPDQDMSSEFEYFVEVFCVTWLFLHFLHHILA